MKSDEIIAAWNAQADHMNTWGHLGEDEKLAWAMKLEREACAKVCEDAFSSSHAGRVVCNNLAADIRARGKT